MKQTLFIALLLTLTACGKEYGNGRELFQEDVEEWKQKLPFYKKTDTLFNLGAYCNMTSKFDSARFYLEQALQLPGGREFQGGRILANIANSYGFQGRYAEALKYYLEALEVGEKMASGRKFSAGWYWGMWNSLRVFANASEICYLTGNLKHALNYVERGERIIGELGEHSDVLYLVPQLFYVAGAVWLDRGDADRAEKYFARAFEISINQVENEWKTTGNGNSGGMYWYCAYGKEGLAQVCLMRKDYAGALELAAEALAFAKAHGDPQVTAKILTALSDIYHAQENYAESAAFALKAMETDSVYVKLNPALAYNMAVASLHEGNRERAGAFFDVYSNQMQSNTDNKFRETMAGMEVIYETEKKELRIADLERQKILYIFIGIAGLLLAMAIWMILRQKIKNERKEKLFIAANAVFEGENRERKRFARDLHDGVNSMLIDIKSTVNNRQSQRFDINLKIDECIEQIRRIARDMMPVSLERYGLKAVLEDRCRLFPQARFNFWGDNARLGKNIETALYYCACELVNNAVKHSGATKINVYLIMKDGRVSLTVEDDGSGFDYPAVNSFGLNNICNRVAVINGKIDIATATGKGAEINIELQLKR